jgi:hypothetical protein
MELNIKQLKKWIAALDSGEYKQSIGRLQGPNGYCCLGVATKCLVPLSQIEIDHEGYLIGTVPFDQKSAPKWLKEISLDFNKQTGYHLTSLNDVYGYSFTEIATLLELIYIHKILD